MSEQATVAPHESGIEEPTGPATGADPARSRAFVRLARASTLPIEPVRWLWDGWLARGKFHLLAGAPGQGKTTLALALAATVTVAGRWPDGSHCEHAGNVVIYSGEDDPSDTLAPRLLAMGADLDCVYFVGATQGEDGPLPFDPARDLPLLADAITGMGGADLVILDPVVGAVTGDSHKNTETRRGLQAVADLAAEAGCAVIGVTHFSKGGQGIDPAMRVIGSVAFTALARVVIVAAKVAQDQAEQGEAGPKPKRLIARAKSNIGPDDGGFEYYLEQAEARPGVIASRIAWGDPVKGSARDLLTDPDGDDDALAAQDAVEVLRAELASDVWTPARDVEKSLKDAGFTKKQIRRAATKLRVIKRKAGFRDGWRWRLPIGPDPEMPADDGDEEAAEAGPQASDDTAEDAPLPPEDAQGANINNGHLGHLRGHLGQQGHLGGGQIGRQGSDDATVEVEL